MRPASPKLNPTDKKPSAGGGRGFTSTNTREEAEIVEAMIKVPDGVYAVNYFDNYYTSQKPLNSVRRTTLFAYRLRFSD